MSADLPPTFPSYLHDWGVAWSRCAISEISVSPILIIVLQYRWLSKGYPYTGRLRLAYRIKGTIVLLVQPSIAFGVADVQNGGRWRSVLDSFYPFPHGITGFQRSTTVLEWVIAFGFAFYLISSFWDLRLSKLGKSGHDDHEKLKGSRLSTMPSVSSRIEVYYTAINISSACDISIA